MLTRLVVQNFKTLEAVDVDLGQNVVFIGPNNSGKTTALQALALWRTGVREWWSRRSLSRAKERTGVTINRRDLTHTPVRDAKLLWRGGRVFESGRANGKQETSPVYMRVAVEGQDAGSTWTCKLEFYYANPESFYCRPVRDDTGDVAARLPEAAEKTKIAFLPPMSGLATDEAELQAGRIDVLIGEGRTAEVLRNLCLRVFESRPEAWRDSARRMEQMFGISLKDPIRDPARGSVELAYREHGYELDISSAGRGLQQTLLLLAHLHANPGAVLLLDEPDAHLEILRQREIYSVLTDAAQTAGGQIIAASHSEVLLNESADRDVVIAFVGRPHRMNNRGAQVRKALAEIGFDQYFQASIRPGVLYLEGATDLANLRAFAELLGHPACATLWDPFVHYVGNQPRRAEDHFYGLREAKPDLRAFALFDRPSGEPSRDLAVDAHWWRRRELENYFSRRDVMLRFAAAGRLDDLVDRAQHDRRVEAMTAALAEIERSSSTFGVDPWGDDIKASDDVFPHLFRLFYEKLGLKNEMNKSDFHELIRYLRPDEVDPEVIRVLDRVHAVLGATP